MAWIYTNGAALAVPLASKQQMTPKHKKPESSYVQTVCVWALLEKQMSTKEWSHDGNQTLIKLTSQSAGSVLHDFYFEKNIAHVI